MVFYQVRFLKRYYPFLSYTFIKSTLVGLCAVGIVKFWLRFFINLTLVKACLWTTMDT